MTIKEIKVFSDGEHHYKIKITHDVKYLTCSYDYDVDDEDNDVLCLYTSPLSDGFGEVTIVRVPLGIKLWGYDIGVHSDKYFTTVTLHSKRSSCSIDVPIEMYSFEK